MEATVLLALDPRVIERAWKVIEPLLPTHISPAHPLGTHRQRISDYECFIGILQRLVTGCSWDVAARLCSAGETTLRTRRTEWLQAGVFDELVMSALDEYDNEIGLEFDDVALDGSAQKAPFGGEGTGRNPTDRGKQGWKWSIATDMNGIPIGWAIEGANRHDSKLLIPTLEDVLRRGYFDDIETLHLDRGYDTHVARDDCAEMGISNTVIAKKRKVGTKLKNVFAPLGLRWPVERTNSWLSNFGQMRRNTDRSIAQRLGQLAFAIAMILFVKLFKQG